MISKDEFLKFYKTKILPQLSELEAERIEYNKKTKPYATLTVIGLWIVCVFFVLLFWVPMLAELSFFPVLLDFIFSFFLPIIITGFVLLFIGAFGHNSLKSNYIKNFKRKLTSKILMLYGNMYFSGEKDVISINEIRETGLFSRFSLKIDDDIIIGIHKGCNFVISETALTHEEGSGKSSRTVTDFKGIILKIQMQKPFSGKTSIGTSVSTCWGKMQNVELESVEFMKERQIASTDQIEARYILTPSFIEKIEGLQNFYDAQKLVSASFMGGYAYLFIPSGKNFFEVPLDKTLHNPDNYFNIYQELNYILSVVDYLNLDRNLGL